MSKKVFIVTGPEIAAYTSAQQESLLASIERLAEEYPTATIADLTNYARQYLVLQATGEVQPGIVEEVVNPEQTEVEEVQITPVAEYVEEELLNPTDEDYAEYVGVAPQPEFESVEQYASEQTEYYQQEATVEVEQLETVESEPVETGYETVQELVEGAPVYESEPATEVAPVAETPAELEEPPAVAEDAQVAFRNVRFQGLLREVGKLDN